MSLRERWEEQAPNWIRWAREPGHDSYWKFHHEAFLASLPAPRRLTLDVGCGEGRVTRDLRELGHRVVGVDQSASMIAAAREADPDGEYVEADATAMPFEDGAADLAIAFMSLMDIEDMPGAVREAARALQPGGRFCACVTHPILDAGRWESRDANAPFLLVGNYRERRRFEGTFERAGMQITFRGWCHPFEAYARAFENAGLLLERIREPGDPGEDPRHARVPLFLFMRALKSA